MTPRIPQLTISHRSRAISYDRSVFENLAAAALPQCLALAVKHNAILASLHSVEVSVLGRRAMARVHRDFLQIPGATDVITFPYGEILVCADIAAERAVEFGHTSTQELVLYVIHGFLHLSGFDDLAESDAKRMAVVQMRILQSLSR